MFVALITHKKIFWIKLQLNLQFTNLCKSAVVRLAVLNLLFLNSLLKSQFTNLCKSTFLKSAVLKITVKISVYKLTTQSKIIMLYFNVGQFAIIILN